MPLSPRLYHWFVRPAWFTQKYIHQRIQRHFALQDKIVLDFGSGTGANSVMCLPDQYLGIEPSEERVNLAKRLYPLHQFQVFDTKKIPAPDSSIDYVVVIAVLHHIPDELIAGYLSEFERILRPGGMVIALEPCFVPTKPFNNRFMNWYDDGKHIRDEGCYMRLFQDHRYECQVLERFSKCIVYNELLFSAVPPQMQLVHTTETEGGF